MHSEPKVLIFSQLFEPSVDRVANYLNAKEIPWARINTDTFPIGIAGCWSNIERRFGSTKLDTDSQEIQISNVEVVWFRRAPHPILPKSLSTDALCFVENEASAFFHGVFSELDEAFWINDIWAERKATNKLNQLKAAKTVGLRTPKTLVSNSPEEVKAFLNSLDGRAIFKPVSGFSSRKNAHPQSIVSHFSERYGTEIAEDDSIENEIVFANIVDSNTIKHLDNIRISPVAFQEYIEKKSDIRITVFGDTFIACEICSQHHEDTKIDFRRMAISSKGFPPHKEIDIPKEIKEKILTLFNRLNIVFGCVDLVRTEDDDFVFLEVNPSGQWLWIETQLNINISEQLADFMVCKIKG